MFRQHVWRSKRPAEQQLSTTSYQEDSCAVKLTLRHLLNVTFGPSKTQGNAPLHWTMGEAFLFELPSMCLLILARGVSVQAGM